MNNLSRVLHKTSEAPLSPLAGEEFISPHNLPNVVFRSLNADDALTYKQIRLAALTSEEARYFTADPQIEMGRSLDDWREVCDEKPDRAIIGAFMREGLIGVWSVKLSETDPTGRTAYYSAVYVRPGYRHIDITKKLIWMWKTWAVLRGCDKAIFTIRADNPWLNEHIRRGAVIKKKYDANFADGSIAPIYLVEHPLCSEHERQAMKLEAELLGLLKLGDGYDDQTDTHNNSGQPVTA